MHSKAKKRVHEQNEEEEKEEVTTKKRVRVVASLVQKSQTDNPKMKSSESDGNAWQNSIFRIMHAQPRSDVLEIVKCKFALPQCETAITYFDESFMQKPLRKLRLQIGCSGSAGLNLFMPKIHHHRYTLRVLDLSRNQLTGEDIVALCLALGFSDRINENNLHKVQFGKHHNNQQRIVAANSVAMSCSWQEKEEESTTLEKSNVKLTCEPKTFESTPELMLSSSTLMSTNSTQTPYSLQILDVSYNSSLGNDAVLYLMRASRCCSSLRALQLKCTGINDDAVGEMAILLRSWPEPCATHEVWQKAISNSENKIFFNLNENCIGSVGTLILGKKLPGYISLTLSKQHIRRPTSVIDKPNDNAYTECAMRRKGESKIVELLQKIVTF